MIKPKSILFFAATVTLWGYMLSCNLKVCEPCVFNANFHITKNLNKITLTADTIDPDFDYSWVLSNGERANNYQFNPAATEAGSYLATLTIRAFGCEVTDTASYFIGNGPQAIIFAAATTCVLESVCTIVFENRSKNAVSYIWKFGDGSTSPSADSIISHTYTKPDTFQVILIATGIPGTTPHSDTLDIIIEPQTFIRAIDVAPGSDKQRVVCIEEKSDNNFNLAVNTDNSLLLMQCSRLGALLPGQNPLTLSGPYTFPEVNYCRKVGLKHVMVGRVLRTISDTDDIYGVALKDDFTAQTAPAAFFDPGNGGDGNEAGNCIISIPGGGYLIAGERAPTGGPVSITTGMYFQKLTSSFTTDGGSIIRHPGDLNRAYQIASIPTGYVVLGNLDGDGTFIRMNQSFDDAVGPIHLPNLFPTDLIKINDNSFIVVGIDGLSSRVFKIDSNGNKVTAFQEQIFPNTELTRGLITSDGYLALIGNKFESSIYKPFFCKINLNTGAQQPSPQIYTVGNTNCQLHFIAETMDNGFIIGGEDSANKIVLIRTNKLGEVKM